MKASRRRTPWLQAAAGIVCVGLVLVFEWTWTTRTAGPNLSGDDRAVARLMLAMADSIQHGSVYQPDRLSTTPYPPFGLWVGALGALVDPAGAVQGMFHAQVLFVGAMAAAMWMALRRSLGWPVAAAATLAVPVYAEWWQLRGQLFLEVQQGCLLVAMAAAYAASEGLRARLPSLLVGGFFGLGLLTKFSFVFFAGVPLLAVLAVAAARMTTSRIAGLGVAAMVVAAGGGATAAAAGRLSWVTAGLLAGSACLVAVISARRWRAPDAGRLAVGIGLVLVAAVAVAGPWYGSHLGALRSFFTANLSQEFDGQVLPLSRVWWTYPAFLGRVALDDVVSLLFAVGAVRVVTSSKHPAGRLALLMVLSGLVALTLQPYRTPRYATPLAAPALLVAAYGLWLPRRARAVVAVLIAAWCVRVGVTTLQGRDHRSDWWNTRHQLPPNNEGALAQLRTQALDPHLQLHSRLPPPREEQLPLGGLAGIVVGRTNARELRSVATLTAGREIPCEPLGLALVAAGANPYVSCTHAGDAELVVTWATTEGPRADLVALRGGNTWGLVPWVVPRLVVGE